MGYRRYHAILVTGSYNHEKFIVPAREYALKVCKGFLVSELIESCWNAVTSFFIAPDGSKEGWEESDTGDATREAMIAYLLSCRYEDGSSPLAWVEIQYGDDNRDTRVIRSSDHAKISSIGVPARRED